MGERLCRDRKSHTTRELLKALEECPDVGNFIQTYVGEFVNGNLKGFLEQLLEQKKLKKADVVRASNINQVYAYQIFAGIKNPSRDKLLALAVAMGLTLGECQDMLRLAEAGELYVKNKRDAVVIFALMNRLNIHELNDLLYELEECTI